MAWYAAHIISYVKFKDGIQDSFPLWENVVLIEAGSGEMALEEAKKIGLSDYDDTEDPDNNGDMTWNERPAYWVFAGIRKLISCNPIASVSVDKNIDRNDPDYRPGHGTEVTYSTMEVGTQEELDKLVRGEPVRVLYED
jgi:hypothetical protein